MKEQQREVEERNRELDLGLSIGNIYIPKNKGTKRPRDDSTPCLQLSFSPSANEEDRFNIKGHCNEEENGNNKKIIALRNYKKINNNRKKLRLTSEQYTLLEHNFIQYSTLNHVQKHSLAEQLNLTPRQVEVWFQNRRARSKQKQTEADSEFLEKSCERLIKENIRLEKELQELKSQLCHLHHPMGSSSSPKISNILTCPISSSTTVNGFKL